MNMNLLFYTMDQEEILTFLTESISESENEDLKKAICDCLYSVSGGDTACTHILGELINEGMKQYALSSDTYREIVCPPVRDDVNYEEEDLLMNPREI